MDGMKQDIKRMNLERTEENEGTLTRTLRTT